MNADERSTGSRSQLSRQPEAQIVALALSGEPVAVGGAEMLRIIVKTPVANVMGDWRLTQAKAGRPAG